jgi:non-lysosomal glucosylceramidase
VSNRRTFLKTVALTGSLAAQTPSQKDGRATAAAAPPASAPGPGTRAAVQYPRVYTGRQLAMLAFPLGGIGTGSISLGGRGQLRDWEIFNRPDKGRAPAYAFASIWAQSGREKPVAKVLEARLLPPYEGASGLGSKNAPGLRRLEGATFTGEYPVAHIAFRDSKLPVKVSLEAFSPFIPHDAEESGLPVAILRYRVRNPGQEKATVSIAFSLDNPVNSTWSNVTRMAAGTRINEHRNSGGIEGLFMRNPGLPANDPQNGSFAVCVMHPESGKFSHLSGWTSGKWWASPLLFWDDFSSDGQLGPEAALRQATGSICMQKEIAGGAEAEYTFLLAWHFPNRTPEWSGWTAPKGEENAIIGNHYCRRFADAWEGAQYAAGRLPELEARTRRFVSAMRESTLPAAVRDAAMSNLSTLATQTSFRTADGEFHGFEGCSDQNGCCFGNCTHVWNYETATQYLFPALARSLRKSAFGFSEDEQGAMRHRQILPDGKERYGYAAADGQMGQIMKVYLDWRLSGDTGWLRGLWPQVKRGLSYAWVPGGWDADRDGVMEGVQHNTYDIEFYGPNPLCGIYYLGALRAVEEMAKVLGDTDTAEDCHRLFTNGSRWIDENLFNGEFYIQKVRSIPKDQIAPVTVSDMGSDRPDKPDFQLGEGCLVDQLLGQYLAELCGLGPLVDSKKIRKTLESIYRYNYKRDLYDHDSVQRIFALNDEAAIVICDYGRGKRPAMPFPYFAEVMTGFEYATAVHMIFAGMAREGVECIENIRRRYDGERRNPWDEAECGHHYARAMASWSAIPALSGFRYHGGEKSLEARPRVGEGKFTCFWSTATGWGAFSQSAQDGRTRFSLSVTEGTLPLRSLALAQAAGQSSVKLGGASVRHERQGGLLVFAEDIVAKPGAALVVLL